MKEKKRILLADDEALNLKLLTAVLNAEGYVTETSVNGVEAVEKSRSLLPDLIILDIRMPEMDGVEACTLIKKNSATKDIPVVMVTAYADEESRVNAMSAGADGFITKPIQIADLVSNIDNLIK